MLRQGKWIGTVKTQETTAEEITEMMVGRSVSLGGGRKEVMSREDILELRGVSYHNGQKEKLKNINLNVCKGENPWNRRH